MCVCVSEGGREGRGDEIDVSIQRRTEHALNSTGSTGCQCHNLLESAMTSHPVATGRKCSTPVDQPTPSRGEGLGGNSTTSLGSTDPGKINLFHRFSVGSTEPGFPNFLVPIMCRFGKKNNVCIERMVFVMAGAMGTYSPTWADAS